MYKYITPEIINTNLFGQNELILQFVDMYLKQTPADFEKLREAIAKGAHTEIDQAAHHIKPTMTYIGANQLRDAFQQLEDMGKSGKDMDKIRQFFSGLETDMDHLIQELTDYKNHLVL